MTLQQISQRTIRLAFTSLMSFIGSWDLSAQEVLTDSVQIIEKSGKKPRYSFKQASPISGKKKSPFAIYAIPQVQ